MQLTLVVPELLWPEPGDQATWEHLPCPGLEWLLVRGEARRESRTTLEAALAAAFGLPAEAPFGALRLLGEAAGPDAREGCWLCADPVHMRFHQERIVLADAGAFDLADDEARELAQSLNAEFADLGEFHVVAPRRWYLKLHAEAEVAAMPLSAVAGRRLERDPGAQGSPLQRWMNEIQMVLHGHPVNARRTAAGQPAVNSLWLWGAGPLTAGDADFACAWTGEPLAAGLARAAGIPVRPQPAGLAPLLANAARGESQLVVLDNLLPPVVYEDPEAWRQAMQDLEATWFAPLRRALGREVKGVTLAAPTVYGLLAWDIPAAGRWKFWRRPRPLADLAKEFAA